MFNYSDLLEAYESFAGISDYEATVFVNIEKEKIVLWYAEGLVDDEEHERVECELTQGKWMELPKKQELNLGVKLVFRFANAYFSEDDIQKVSRIFSRKGAYQKWRSFLESKDMVQEWYRFRDEEQDKALKRWLTDMKIPFKEA